METAVSDGFLCFPERFKSYYVVWKLFYILYIGLGNEGLNRTM